MSQYPSPSFLYSMQEYKFKENSRYLLGAYVFLFVNYRSGYAHFFPIHSPPQTCYWEETSRPAIIKQYESHAYKNNCCDGFLSIESGRTIYTHRWYIIFTIKKRYYLD